MGSLLALGFLLGMRHATDPDHVAAVSTLAVGGRSRGAAWLLAACWGLGHATTVLAAGGLIILLRVSVPPRLGLGLEFVVGLVLILLGVMNLLGYRPAAGATVHSHEHEHHGPPHQDSPSGHAHPHLHLPPEAQGWLRAKVRQAGPAQLWRSAAIGVVHGLAGSAGAALLVMSAISEPLAALLYLLIFGAGTLAGMLALSVLMDLSMSYLARWWTAGERFLWLGTGLLSLFVGLKMLYETSPIFSSSPVWSPR